jgi:hypothetical protein
LEEGVGADYVVFEERGKEDIADAENHVGLVGLDLFWLDQERHSEQRRKYDGDEP